MYRGIKNAKRERGKPPYVLTSAGARIKALEAERKAISAQLEIAMKRETKVAIESAEAMARQLADRGRN